MDRSLVRMYYWKHPAVRWYLSNVYIWIISAFFIFIGVVISRDTNDRLIMLSIGLIFLFIGIRHQVKKREKS